MQRIFSAEATTLMWKHSPPALLPTSQEDSLERELRELAEAIQLPQSIAPFQPNRCRVPLISTRSFLSFRVRPRGVRQNIPAYQDSLSNRDQVRMVWIFVRRSMHACWMCNRLQS